jgi:hypothetical protein
MPTAWRVFACPAPGSICDGRKHAGSTRPGVLGCAVIGVGAGMLAAVLVRVPPAALTDIPSKRTVEPKDGGCPKNFG